MPIPLVTRILVADDHPIVRSGPRTVLDAQPDLRVEILTPRELGMSDRVELARYAVRRGPIQA